MKKWTTIIVIAMIVIGLSTGGVLAAREFYFKEETDVRLRAEEGDTVEIHYVGRLSDDRLYDGERIFDTSYENIPGVRDPKFTLTYNHERERGDVFNFTLGEGVIEGWNENVKGMREGEIKRFSVPPEKGYGEANEGLKSQIGRTESMPVYESMNLDEFTEKYVEPRKNMVVEDPFWGWDKIVTSVGQERVRLRNEPDLEETYRPTGERGWDVEVLSIDSTARDGEGVIEIEHTVHEPLAVDSELLSLYDEKFVDLGEGILIPNGDYITVDFNDEVNGKTLHFEVEVLNIEKGR
ncbi:MAG: FKBP-type peptidyl-prolyl cis-trans isomerase [Candidatus Natronoplasma sp.]